MCHAWGWEGGANPSQLPCKVHPSLGSRDVGARHTQLVQGPEQSPVAAVPGKQGNQAGLQGAANVFCLMPASSSALFPCIYLGELTGFRRCPLRADISSLLFPSWVTGTP